MIRKNKKFIDPRYFMDEKTESIKEGLTPGHFEPSVAPKPDSAEPTNMNDGLREFAQWVLKVDGHIESLSGQHMTAAAVPSDINLYDLWLTGASPGAAAQDLMMGGH
jgi:hypothetical protein